MHIVFKQILTVFYLNKYISQCLVGRDSRTPENTPLLSISNLKNN